LVKHAETAKNWAARPGAFPKILPLFRVRLLKIALNRLVLVLR